MKARIECMMCDDYLEVEDDPLSLEQALKRAGWDKVSLADGFGYLFPKHLGFKALWE